MPDAIGIILANVATLLGAVYAFNRTLNKRFDDASRRFDDMNKRFDELKADLKEDLTRINQRMQYVEERVNDTNKRIDQIAQDIATLRDRTGKLGGSLSTFIQDQRSSDSRNAA